MIFKHARLLALSVICVLAPLTGFAKFCWWFTVLCTYFVQQFHSVTSYLLSLSHTSTHQSKTTQLTYRPNTTHCAYTSGWLVNTSGAGRPQTKLPLNARLMFTCDTFRAQRQINIRRAFKGSFVWGRPAPLVFTSHPEVYAQCVVLGLYVSWAVLDWWVDVC